MTEQIKALIEKLASLNVDEIKSALDEIPTASSLKSEQKVEMASAISTMFYRDHSGNKELLGVIGKAEEIIGSFGADVVEWLIDQLADADAESAEHFARALGIAGADAVDKTIAAFDKYREVPYSLINLLLAAGHFTDAGIVRLVPKLSKLLESGDKQLKSSAMYCAGRVFNRIPSSAVADRDKTALFDKIFNGVSDPSALVRRHAVRALGKGVRNSYFTADQVEKANKAFRAILGLDNFDWDDAYIVRHEAQHQLHFCAHGSGKDKEPMLKRNYKQDFKIIEKRELCPNTFYFKVNAPFLAKKIQAGQFVIIRPTEKSERIPLSIAGWDRDKGYLEIIIMAAGRTSTEATRKNVGDSFTDVVGPLGQRSHIAKFDGACVVIGGGYGTGAVIPTARDLREKGNKVYGIVGARSKNLLIMVDELRGACDEVFTTTNDGSDGIEGFVTHALEKIVAREKVSMILAVGPVPMMMAVTKMTQGKDIQTWVSLNAIMVDGTGMCGACRVTVDGKTKFACFHGPDFDGHKVDFDELVKRQKMFVEKEKIALAALNG